MTTNPVRDAMHAIEEGRVSAEEVVRVALSGGRQAVSALVARAGRRPSRTPRTWAEKRWSDAVMVDLVASTRERWVGVDGVRHVHWGTKRVHGRPSGRCLVFTVEEKGTADSIPAHLSIERGARTYIVATDVLEAPSPGSVPVSSAAGPVGLTYGVTPIGVKGARAGTLTAVTYADGPAYRAIVSGHIVGGASSVGLGGAWVPVDPPVVTGTIDAAAAHLSMSQAEALAVSRVRVRDFRPSDVGKRVQIATHRGVIDAAVTDDDALIAMPEGTVRGAVLDGAHTWDGDSGSAVFVGPELVGMVVGLGTPFHQGTLCTVVFGARRSIHAVV